jgi:hypothetical protein
MKLKISDRISKILDIKENSLKDLMYNRDDIKEMLSELNENIDKKIEDEVSYYLNMSGKYSDFFKKFYIN